MAKTPAMGRKGALVAIAASVACGLAIVPQQALANGCLFPPVWDPDTSTYTISTAEQLRTLYQGACDMSATIRLANDIDLTDTGEFLPIGSTVDPFTGTFDGAGHAITGLQVTSPASSGFGLIGWSSNATIRDLRVTGTVISLGVETTGGILAGSATNTTITNVHVNGTVNVPDGAGGMVGSLAGGSITNSSAAVVVTSGLTAGGIAASIYHASQVAPEISGTSSTGSATSIGGTSGGIAGSIFGGTVRTSSSTAIVHGNRAGGLVGNAQSSGDIPATISDSFSTGDVVANPGSVDEIGGILGGNCLYEPASLVRNYFAGTLTKAGGANTGGILGGAGSCLVSVGTQATTTGNLWNSDTTGPAGAGGTVGVARTTAQMRQIGTYTELGWSIANGWDANPTATWLICSQVNNGYPFQRGQLAATACKAPAEAAAGTTPAALTATLLPSRRRVVSGQRLRIGIRTANPGGTAAEAVTSCIRLPSRMVVASTGGALRSGRTACFRVGTVAAGDQVTKVITVRAVSTRRVRVTVTGSARASGVAKVQAVATQVTVTPRAPRARVTG